MLLKKRKKFGRPLYAIWWAKLIIKLPDDACIRKLILDPVPLVSLVEDRDIKTSLLKLPPALLVDLTLLPWPRMSKRCIVPCTR